ncbi:hypothetical protein Ocin01_10381 [Orchesella cincta]|uniref:Uncharacterized protein n=1 Tax=Orchesella cincta TaxID=48709 RepID=A0A1D2MTE9_ORCCI|nr:hypothetical protein Ocin01_10381 [Orchesella cincta]
MKRFQADGVLNNNVTVTDTVHYYEDSRSANVKFSKLSYAGPIVMGVGETCFSFEALIPSSAMKEQILRKGKQLRRQHLLSTISASFSLMVYQLWDGNRNAMPNFFWRK